jgi:hypothetical protein
MVMFAPGALDRDPRLGQALRRVRARYALRVLVRGLAIVAVAVVLGVAASAYGLESFRYSRTAVLVIRVALYGWIALTFVRFVANPLWRGRKQASDAAIARYVEEHEPSLDAALRGAVDVVNDTQRSDESSTALKNRLVGDVVRRLEAIDLPQDVERAEIRRAGVALGSATILGIAFFLLAPGFMRQAFPYLFDPFSHSGRSATPYRVAVLPGNHTIARGSDQEFVAQLAGFDDAVELVTRTGAGDWVRSPMVRDEDGVRHRFLLLSVLAPTEYFAESRGTRSEVFRIDVVDKPYVKKIDLEYRFPAYARLDPQKIEGSGDVTALVGTNVLVSITSTVPVKAGRLVIQGQESAPIPLEVASGGLTLSGRMRVSKDGFYKVEMQGPEGAFGPASADYVIDVVEDLPPRVSFDRPGRDTQATPIEEVFTQAKAEDDFGVAKLDLVYSINGGPEKVVPLHTAPVLKDVVASHTFFLEEMAMKPGDFISYYARATDVGAPGRQATSDIYFLEARPYRRDFHQAEQPGGSGGGGGGDSGGSLSQQQRQVIAATFRLVRDQAEGQREAKTLAQDAQTVALIQGRLRAQVETLVARMLSRGALPDGSPMHGTADEMRKATAKMADAETELKAPRPKDALPPEQEALAHLQRAEAAFRDVQVAFGGGGGGGGGSSSNAEELADLYELDLDKLRNQYETLQSGAQEKRDQQVDDALSRLQELARRQEQENERARQRAARAPNQAGGGGGGGSQQQLADEAEELGRRLERLTREHPSPGLEESARRLKEAAQAMRQQANSSRGPSSAGAGSPLGRLREARRLLDSERSTRLDRDLTGFKEKADELKRSQAQIASEMRELAEQGPSSPGQSGSSKADRVRERKESLASEVADLESSLDKVASESRREQKETSRKLQAAANGIRDAKLKEKIRYTRGLVDRAGSPDAERLEADIGQTIDDLGKRIGEASKSVGTSPEKKRADALDRARELARSLDSMQERLRARGSSPPAGDQEAQGDKGQASSGGGSSQGGSPPGSPQNQGRAQRGEGSQDGQGQGPAVGGAGGGMPRGFGGGGGGRLGATDLRQLRSELNQRAQDAESLRRDLEASGVSSPQAAALAQRLQGLVSDRNFKDPLGLADLTAQVANDVKMLEYALRREQEGGRPALQLSGSEELPPGYRAMVEEYYRTLGKKPVKK